jgi:hypothetical protein
MRFAKGLLVAAGFAVFATPAMAELQTVTIDGSLQIRANWYSNTIADRQPTFEPGTRWPGGFLPGRPTGFRGGPITSVLGFDNREPNLDFVEMRTRLGFTADFTNEVSAYIEFDSYNIWGDDFRSDYITGFDRSGDTDISLYQAYIQASEMWGYPLQLRIGRQEISLGSEWLVGVNDTSSFFTGLSFDAARVDYATDMFSVTAFAATLLEESIFDTRQVGGPGNFVPGLEEDGDIWFYGIYASYLGLEDITLDAYWLYLRDARSINDTDLSFWTEFWEDVFSLDDYNVTKLHTIGLRGAGTFGQFDFDVEVAYQWGKLGQQGYLFAPFGIYGDDNLSQSEWAATATVGYTFDMQYSPRVWLGGHYFGATDNRDISFLQWLNPWDRSKGSTAFNRLFSNHEYTEFFANTDESNLWIINGGVEVQVTESVAAELYVAHFRAIEAFAAPVHFNLGRYRIPVAPALSFWTTDNSKNLGTEVGLYVTYNYTEDLVFEAGVAHLFASSGLTDGQFVVNNGLGFTGGSSDNNPTYVYLETRLAF